MVACLSRLPADLPDVLLVSLRTAVNAVTLVGLRSGLPKTHPSVQHLTILLHHAPAGVEPVGFGTRTQLHIAARSGVHSLVWCPRSCWWDEMESNHPSRMTADLQTAPLPLTVYHPMLCRQIRIDIGDYTARLPFRHRPRTGGRTGLEPAMYRLLMRSIRHLQCCLRGYLNTFREQTSIPNW